MFANGAVQFHRRRSNFTLSAVIPVTIPSQAGFWRPALDSRNIPSIYPEGFLPLETSSSEDQSLVVGLRGALGDGWRWDTSLNYGANRFKLHVDNSLNTSLGVTSPAQFLHRKPEERTDSSQCRSVARVHAVLVQRPSGPRAGRRSEAGEL